jgi:ferredoxin
VNCIHHKLHSDTPRGIKLADLAYQSKENHLEMEKVSLEAAKADMPRREIDAELCNQCQICAEVCPMDTVAFTPYPEFGHDCVFCFSCMKQCPEQAIKVDFSEIWQRIKDRAAFFPNILIRKYSCSCYLHCSLMSYYNPKVTVPRIDMIKSIIMKMQSNIKSTIVLNIFPTLSSAVAIEKFLSFFNCIK